MFKYFLKSKKEIFLFISIFIAIIITTVESRKRKKKPRTPKKPFNPKDVKPSRINDELYCNMCKELVKETITSLFNKRHDYEVIDAIEKVCESELLYPNRKIFYFIINSLYIFLR